MCVQASVSALLLSLFQIHSAGRLEMPIWRLCFFSTGAAAVPSEAPAWKKRRRRRHIHSRCTRHHLISVGRGWRDEDCASASEMHFDGAERAIHRSADLILRFEESNQVSRREASPLLQIFWADWIKGKGQRADVCIGHFFVCLLFLLQKQQEETEPSEKELKCNEGDGRCLAHKGVI